MGTKFDFSSFSRQSTRGVAVYYFKILYKIIKASWILIFLVLSKKSIDSMRLYLFIVLATVLVYVLVRAILQFLNFKFKVTDTDFVLQEGIVSKSHVSIPFEKIQNINFKQNLIQQVINVVEVQIETAGDKSVEISISALSQHRAHALKQLLLSKTTTVNDKIKEEDYGVIQKISVLELLKVSLSENHFKSLLVLTGLGFSFYVQVKDFVETIEIDAQFDVLIKESTPEVALDNVVIFILVIASFFIAILASFFRVFIFHFDLTISIRKGVLEIKQGLFTKRNNIIRKQKVQQLIISTNPLKKILGIYNVSFKQAVSGKQKKGTTLSIVGLKIEQINTLKELVFSNTDFSNHKEYKPHFYYRRKMIFQGFLLLLFCNMCYTISDINQGWEWYLCNVVLIPFIIWMVHQKYNKRFYKLNKEMLWIGKGQIGTSYEYVECFKIQYVTLKQSIFQKRHQVFDMSIQTASGKIRIPCVPQKEAYQLYDYLLYKSQTVTEAWM